jgi:hypothetical protein
MLLGESANTRGERAAAGLKRAANAPTSNSVSLVLSEDAPNLAVRSLANVRPSLGCCAEGNANEASLYNRFRVRLATQ